MNHNEHWKHENRVPAGEIEWLATGNGLPEANQNTLDVDSELYGCNYVKK